MKRWRRLRGDGEIHMGMLKQVIKSGDEAYEDHVSFNNKAWRINKWKRLTSVDEEET